MEKLETFSFAVGRDGDAEDVLVARLVATIVIGGQAAESGAIDGPAGEDLGDFGDVGLGVAGSTGLIGWGVILRDFAADAESVKLEELAGEVLVEAALGGG